MKHDWEYKKLGEVCDVINGLWTGKKPPFVKVGVIRNTNFTKSCTLDSSDIFYTDVEEKSYAKRKLQKGDIIIEKSGGSEKQPVGRPILFELDGEYSFSNFTSTLRINKGFLIPSFLHKVLVGLYFQGKTRPLQSKTTGIHNLDFNKFLRFSIPVPPIPIQEQIVAELDKVSEIIEKKKQQMKELDNLAQSIFYDMFGDPVENEKGWEMKFVKELGEVKIGPFGSLLHKSDYITGGIPLVNPIQMKGDRILTDSDFTVSKEKAEELSSYLLKKGDFVFARRGEIGRCAIVGAEEDGCICGTGSLFVRFKSTIDKLYLLYAVKSKSFSSYLIDQAKGATMLNINCGIVERLEIPTPPLPLQQSFAQKVEAIERQKELITASIKEAQLLFDARMDYWFGE